MADGSIESRPQRLVEFIKMVPEGRAPKRADRSGAGYLPGRAMRYCDAMTSATGYGYWAFPPIDLQLMWDGEQVYWSYDNAACWMPLSGSASGAAQFPALPTNSMKPPLPNSAATRPRS